MNDDEQTSVHKRRRRALGKRWQDEERKPALALATDDEITDAVNVITYDWDPDPEAA
jgi:hypothetical protein